jgi:hypothetical protein
MLWHTPLFDVRDPIDKRLFGKNHRVGCEILRQAGWPGGQSGPSKARAMTEHPDAMFGCSMEDK